MVTKNYGKNKIKNKKSINNPLSKELFRVTKYENGAYLYDKEKENPRMLKLWKESGIFPELKKKYKLEMGIRCVLHTNKGLNSLFMLNLKDSKRTDPFWELSYKGGINLSSPGDIYLAVTREFEEEFPEETITELVLSKNLSPQENGLNNYVDNSTPIARNSDIIIYKKNNFRIARLITNNLLPVKKTFMPKKYTEHTDTKWANISEAYNLLEETAKNGNDRDYIFFDNFVKFYLFEGLFKKSSKVDFFGPYKRVID
ncbi:hypothetical protein K9L97_00975 [Candidatus Woesearchaeota archaeon]|nr:hypothetical protein [Candidatus Woesearchaeota archaeon]